MQQLSELDASFLYLENERTPLHVGGAFVFKKKSSRSKFSYERFKQLIEAQLGSEAFFRQRVFESNLNLEQPVWDDDAEFDLENHLSYVSLADTPSPCPLSELSATIFSQPLSRQHPLWHVSYVDGLHREKRYGKLNFALIIRIHITALDGNTGEDVLSKLLSLSPEIKKLTTAEAWEPKPSEGLTGSWIDEAYSNARMIPKKLAGMALESASSAFYTVLYERLQKLNLPEGLISVLPTPFNQSVSSKRVIDNLIISSADIRSIRQTIGGVTTNDVIMGLCSEALCKYLTDVDALPKNSMTALSPISVRSTSLEVKTGNQLSASLFSLASTEPDPIKRVKRIHENAKNSSHYDDAIAAARLTELIPSCMSGLSARVYSEFLLAQKHKPMFNLPITNIPGPQFPLYMDDNELLEHHCAGPLFDGIGLSITVVSYNGSYSITSVHCPELIAHSKTFSTYLKDALKTLLAGKENLSLLNDTHETKENSGLIEDVVGLVNNLFSFGSKADRSRDNSTP